MEDICPFEIDWLPAGPFVTAQLSFFVPKAHYERAVSWSLQNKGDLDLLVHPNSGCEIEDHSIWAFWGGNSWPIDLTIFTCEYPGCGPTDQLSNNIESMINDIQY